MFVGPPGQRNLDLAMYPLPAASSRLGSTIENWMLALRDLTLWPDDNVLFNRVVEFAPIGIQRPQMTNWNHPVPRVGHTHVFDAVTQDTTQEFAVDCAQPALLLIETQ
jgi:hypothetical protein